MEHVYNVHESHSSGEFLSKLKSIAGQLRWQWIDGGRHLTLFFLPRLQFRNLLFKWEFSLHFNAFLAVGRNSHNKKMLWRRLEMSLNIETRQKKSDTMWFAVNDECHRALVNVECKMSWTTSRDRTNKWKWKIKWTRKDSFVVSFHRFP